MKKEKLDIFDLLKDVLSAVMVLSKIPVPWEKISDDPPEFNRSFWAFPIAGFILVLISGIVFLFFYLLSLLIIVKLMEEQRRPLRHDIQRRRTLKAKHVLLRQYGVYTLSTMFFFFAVYSLNKKFLNPPEYESKEEKKSKKSVSCLSVFAVIVQNLSRGLGFRTYS